LFGEKSRVLAGIRVVYFAFLGGYCAEPWELPSYLPRIIWPLIKQTRIGIQLGRLTIVSILYDQRTTLYTAIEFRGAALILIE